MQLQLAMSDSASADERATGWIMEEGFSSGLLNHTVVAQWLRRLEGGLTE